MMKEADTDLDGKIDRAEFVKVWLLAPGIHLNTEH